MIPKAPGIEHRRDQVIGKAGHADERGDAGAAGERELRLEDVDADAAMLHVEDDEVGAGIRCDLAEARREELGGEAPLGGLGGISV